MLRAPGTELEVGMARGGKWCAADETTVHGDRFRANMPTEEVFTSPDPRRTTGTFRCTRPLTLDGRRIDGIHGRFAAAGWSRSAPTTTTTAPTSPRTSPAIAAPAASARSRWSTPPRGSA